MAVDLKQLVLVRRSRNTYLQYSQNRHCKTGLRGCGRYQRATRSLQKEGRARRRMYRTQSPSPITARTAVDIQTGPKTFRNGIEAHAAPDNEIIQSANVIVGPAKSAADQRCLPSPMTCSTA